LSSSAQPYDKPAGEYRAVCCLPKSNFLTDMLHNLLEREDVTGKRPHFTLQLKYFVTGAISSAGLF